MSAKVNITLPGFSRDFRNQVNKEIKLAISRKIQGVIKGIKARIQNAMRAAITNSVEYQSFFGGRLQAELGIPDPTVMDVIIDTWVSGVLVKYNSSGNSFGSISIGMIESDYSDVLTLPEASFLYTSGKGSGIIDWLRFLLIEGSAAIVRDFEFSRIANQQSRTGLGLMIRRQGGIWRVPAEFSGTPNDNFVLRALDAIDKEIDKAVNEELTKGFR